MGAFSSSHAAPPVDVAAVVLPQLRSRSHADVSSRVTVLRAVAAGIAADVRPHDLRRLIRSLGSPDQVALVSDDAHWWRTVREQRTHVARQGSAESEYKNRLAYARLAIARVTTPVPAGVVSDRRLVKCRRALAIIASHGIKASYRKTLIASAFLATVMGVSVPTAVRILRTLEKELKVDPPRGFPWRRHQVGTHETPRRRRAPEIMGYLVTIRGYLATGPQSQSYIWWHPAQVCGEGPYLVTTLADVLDTSKPCLLSRVGGATGVLSAANCDNFLSAGFRFACPPKHSTRFAVEARNLRMAGHSRVPGCKLPLDPEI